MNAKVLSALGILCLTSITASGVPVNLSSGKSATASSEGWGSVVADGIDGNRNGSFSLGSVWHTSPGDAGPFWYQVDLGDTFYLDHVRIYPRTDERQDSVSNFRLEVLDASDAVVWQADYLAAAAADFAWGTADLRGIQGRKVRLQRYTVTAPNLLTFAEFEVWGQSTPIAANLALNKPTTASPPYAGILTANKANDGVLDSDYSHPGNPIYHSDSVAAGNFWEVDLESTNELGYVLIFNRVDSYSTSDIQLSVLDGARASVYSTTLNISAQLQVLSGDQYGITLTLPAGVTGRYLRIETLQNEFLALGEVQVFPRILDATPPAATAPNFRSTTKLMATVSFSEPLTPATATNPAHYTFTGGATVTNVTLLPGDAAVLLDVSGLPQNSAYSLTVTGVTDLAGNAIVPTNFTGFLGLYDINWALAGTADASSTAWGGTPNLANDGGTDGGFGRGSVYHSANTTGDWWAVDLGGEKPIGLVRVWLRTDCCGERNNNLQVIVLDNASNEVSRLAFVGNPFSNNPQAPTNMFYFHYRPGTAGRYVRVEHTLTPDFLMLAEVEVIAPYQNVGITVTQSPTNQVVDENHTATFGPVAVSVTGAPAEALTVVWLWNGTNVPGVMGNTFTTSVLSTNNNGDQFAALFYFGGVGATSAVATLTVVPDTNAPVLTSALPIHGYNQIALRYDELMEPVSLGEYWYHLFVNAVGLDTIAVGADNRSSLLSVTNLEATLGHFVLFIEGPTDLAGNPLISLTTTGRFLCMTNNLALAGTASMSTVGTYGNITASAHLAIDGNTNGNFWDGSVAHNAEPDNDRWWEVDLGATKNIGVVRIWWRTDAPAVIHPRDAWPTLKVLDEARNEVWSRTIPGLPDLPSTDFIPTNVAGRIVRFEPGPTNETHTMLFHLAEVQVFEAWPDLRVSVERSGHNVIVSWPSHLQGFVLEGTDHLPSTTWTNVPGVVNNSVTVDAGAGNGFFRLRLDTP